MINQDEASTVKSMISMIFALMIVFGVGFGLTANNFTKQIVELNKNAEEDNDIEQEQYLEDSVILKLRSICDAQTIDKNKKVQMAMEYSKATNVNYYDVNKEDIYISYCEQPARNPYGY